MLLNPKNRQTAVAVLVSALVFTTSRFLVDRANRRRLQKQSKRLFQRFQSKFTGSSPKLFDADNSDDAAEDDEFFFGRQKMETWELDQYLMRNQGKRRERHGKKRQIVNLANFNKHRGKVNLNMRMDGLRSEEMNYVGADRLIEVESTNTDQSGTNLKRLAMATKALSGRPSVYQQTKYLDEIEEVLKKRKRKTKHNAQDFLNKLEIVRSEAIAKNLLKQNLEQKQDSQEYREQIEESRKYLINRYNQGDGFSEGARNHLQRFGQEDGFDQEYSFSDGEDSEEDDFERSLSQKGKGSETLNKIDLTKINTKSDQIFFEFFGMYTKDTVKQRGARTKAQQNRNLSDKQINYSANMQQY